MPASSLFRRAAVAALILSGTRTPAQFTISEFLADNASGLRDADGDTSDWLELENSGTIPASASGWFLTDDPTDLRKWPLPDVTVNPGARLVVFCSGKDRRIPTAELHASFSLDAAGEFLALVKPDGSTIASGFSPAFPASATRRFLRHRAPCHGRLSHPPHQHGTMEDSRSQRRWHGMDQSFLR